MTYEQAILRIKDRLGVNYKPTRDAEINALLNSNINIAMGITGCKTLSQSDMEIVVNAVIMDYYRSGEEGISYRSAIGISTQYENSYDYLKKNLKKSNRRLTGD